MLEMIKQTILLLGNLLQLCKYIKDGVVFVVDLFSSSEVDAPKTDKGEAETILLADRDIEKTNIIETVTISKDEHGQYQTTFIRKVMHTDMHKSAHDQAATEAKSAGNLHQSKLHDILSLIRKNTCEQNMAGLSVDEQEICAYLAGQQQAPLEIGGGG